MIKCRRRWRYVGMLRRTSGCAGTGGAAGTGGVAGTPGGSHRLPAVPVAGTRGYAFTGDGTFGGLLAASTWPTTFGGLNGIRTSSRGKLPYPWEVTNDVQQKLRKESSALDGAAAPHASSRIRRTGRLGGVSRSARFSRTRSRRGSLMFRHLAAAVLGVFVARRLWVATPRLRRSQSSLRDV